MKILVAPDSFKDCMSSDIAASAIAAGIREVLPEAQITCIPLADGGEGTVKSLVNFTRGRIVEAPVHDPLMRKMRSFFGILGDNETAVVEVAAASGLELLKEKERNPLYTTSYGTGELIRHALDAGCRKFVVGLGGSAVNDGGAGLLQSLGGLLLDAHGKPLEAGGEKLKYLRRIDLSGLDKRLQDCTFRIACDVNNPLTGPRGASAVYGPQKGATAEMVSLLDDALAHYADLLEAVSGKALREIPGSGAAGGMALPFLAFFNTVLKPGFELIAETGGLESLILNHDLVITGEGSIDRQTLSGKVPSGVCRLGKKCGRKVFVFAGTLQEGAELLHEEGATAIIPLCDRPMPLEEALRRGEELLRKAAERMFRVLWAGRSIS